MNKTKTIGHNSQTDTVELVQAYKKLEHKWITHPTRQLARALTMIWHELLWRRNFVQRQHAGN